MKQIAEAKKHLLRFTNLQLVRFGFDVPLLHPP
jgi:hypothetical protein